MEADKRIVPGTPAFNAPRVIVLAIVVFVGVHLYRMTLSPEDDLQVLLRFAFIPARYVAGGTPVPITFPDGPAGDVWSFFTHAFLHGSWVHLIVNSVWMLAFGSVVARRLGPYWFVLFSLICAAAGAATMLLALGGALVPVIGASGAVSGQFGAALRLLFGRGEGRGSAVGSLRAALSDARAVKLIGVWVAINAVFALDVFAFGSDGAQIAWQAHVGGFAVGFLTFGVFDALAQRGRRGNLPQPPQ